MAKKSKSFDPRFYMKLAIEVMKKSISEPRTDKLSPKVGAVLIKEDGSFETAYRGELRYGDHAEFTLLERKNRSEKLDDCILFATLEPCAPGARKHPKLGCAERIVNARIKKVWVGVEDPDPTVDRKGIKYLQDNGIEVTMFDADLQRQIWEENKDFIAEAEDRAKRLKEEKPEVTLSIKEQAEQNADFVDFSREAIETFIQKANLNAEFGSPQFIRIFKQLGFIEKEGDSTKPTGMGILLFGLRPQLLYQNALIRATFRTAGRQDELATIEGPIVNQANDIQKWYENHVRSQTDRSSAERKINYDFPLEVFRESIINAIVHRDYDIEGAPIYFEINDDAIIIKSPGQPVFPIKLEQIQQLSAPSLSRNPKITYVFDQLGLVEQRGLGFRTIKELPERYDLPLPVISYEEPYMVITFPRSQSSVRVISNNPSLASLSNEELAGYNWLRSRGGASKKEYAGHFGFDDKKAQRHLAKMRALNIIVDNGEKQRSTSLRYVPI